MIAHISEPRSWSTARITGFISLIFVAQLALIFWLGERDPLPSRVRETVSGFRQVPLERQREVVLESPTVFALPASQSFSGEAWMSLPELPVRPFAWTESPRWLPLPVQTLGSGFSPLVVADSFALDPLAARPAPELALPVLARDSVFPEHSVLRVGRGLADRKLERVPRELPSWPNAEVLTDTIVQVAVDQEGRTVSATLLRSSSLRNADAYALQRAWEVTFSPTPPELLEGGPKMQIGELIFEWHTIAAATSAGTNK